MFGWLKKIFSSDSKKKTPSPNIWDSVSDSDYIGDEEVLIARAPRDTAPDRASSRESVKDPERRKKRTSRSTPAKIQKIKKTTKPLDIQVGIDFGTSATKVCYQLLGTNEQIHPITSWKTPKPYPKYSIPSVAAFNEEQELILGIEAADYLREQPWSEGFTRFKVVMAGKLSEEFSRPDLEEQYKTYADWAGGDPKLGNAEWITTAYLAYVMQQVRNYLNIGFRGREMNVSFNICMPLQHVMTDSVWERFRKVLATAQRAELECGTNAKGNDLFLFVQQNFNDTAYVEDSTNRVFAVPESLAQIYAYTHSLGKHDGVHAMIDIGGGSTDISIGTINHRNQPCWFSSKNIPRGMKGIEQALFEQLDDKTLSLAEITKLLSKASPGDSAREVVRNGLEYLWEQGRQTWGEAYGKYKQQHHWVGNNVHVFLCGGGAEVGMSKSIFNQCWRDVGHFNDRWGPYPTHRFMVPANYCDPRDKAPFERMAVAYGLAYPEPVLGKYKLPSETEAVVFPEKEKFYAEGVGLHGEQ